MIRNHTSLDCAGRLLTANAARSLRSAREMRAIFRDLPEAIANTGIVSIILTPDVFECNRLVVTRNCFLLIVGIVQNTDGVIYVKAQQLEPLNITDTPVNSHDFH